MTNNTKTLPHWLAYLYPARVPRTFRGWVLPLLSILAWWASFHFGNATSTILVPIEQVITTAWRMTLSGELYHALSASLGRMLAGFAIGALLGALVGTLLGVSRYFESFIGPTFHAVKQVSLLAWIPLISAWFDLGEPSKIAFIALAAFFPVVLNTFEGIRGVAREHLEVARLFAFTPWQQFSRVILPSALPSIFTGVYLGLILSWLATLAAEYLLTSGSGVGNLLVDGREHFWIDQVILGVILVGAVGYALSWAATRLEIHCLRWRGSHCANYCRD